LGWPVRSGGSPPNQLGWLAALGPSCRHSLVPATTPEARDVSRGVARFDGSQPVRRRASCRFADRGMGLWYPCTVTGTCRIAHAAHVRRPCGSRTADRTSGDREGHRIVPSPGGTTVSVALHPWAILLVLGLGCAGADSGSVTLAGPLGVRGRGASCCEDNDRRYDLYQGQGGKRDTYSGRRGGAWSPTRGRSG
jgi:hypothetical protein